MTVNCYIKYILKFFNKKSKYLLLWIAFIIKLKHRVKNYIKFQFLNLNSHSRYGKGLYLD